MPLKGKAFLETVLTSVRCTEKRLFSRHPVHASKKTSDAGTWRDYRWFINISEEKTRERKNQGGVPGEHQMLLYSGVYKELMYKAIYAIML
ncbi:hypothetical protein COY95_02920 [Candidatus Woesearchaeota archaeon CG_4_10_14_0_8_um_filter_47_5]|nr:MAG: hypothetical protein COY95_02920 [Candidatus Woesearchaeota archaeon CG_4_10_14_0_8_um_filter_47_5]